jgi:hypothetical protein
MQFISGMKQLFHSMKQKRSLDADSPQASSEVSWLFAEVRIFPTNVLYASLWSDSDEVKL